MSKKGSNPPPPEGVKPPDPPPPPPRKKIKAALFTQSVDRDFKIISVEAIEEEIPKLEGSALKREGKEIGICRNVRWEGDVLVCDLELFISSKKSWGTCQGCRHILAPGDQYPCNNCKRNRDSRYTDWFDDT